MRMFLSCAALLAAGSVAAESVPAPGRFDARMKVVPYNRADVVRVVGHYGYSTDIEFATDEATQDIALGDSLAWEVAPAGNHLFVKPRENDAVTNMTVVTNKRVYQLSLDARAAAGPTSARSKGMYFQVRYSYPEEEAASSKTSLAAREAADRRRKMDMAMHKLPEARNWNYYGCGAASLRPLEVFDDGRFTFMRFPGAQEIPAIYMINADGSESIVNGGMRGDHYAVQMTARRFVLRRGASVACIENRSFDARGIATPSGTVSPEVKREVRTLPTASAASVLPAAPRDTATSASNGPGAGGQPLPNRYGTDGKPLQADGPSPSAAMMMGGAR